MPEKTEDQVQRVIERSEDAKEQLGTRVLLLLVPGLIAAIVGGLMVFKYPGPLGLGLGWVLLVGGVVAVGMGIYSLTKAKEIKEHKLTCPFCMAENVFVDQPTEDVRCVDCKRMIPIEGGNVLKVSQVRCGYCQHLNYYSEKSTGLICEQCDSLIPIATEEAPEASMVLDRYTHREDSTPYDLILLDSGSRSEKLITCLQHMLALNRNQIKKILDQTPATLFIGISKKKAELLARDIEAAGGRSESKVSEQQ